ncbi:hypothetical protein [Streptomyces sp. Da 82-17]|uniref:hypothetical protein n=1 Tax=Streptomyces sp. Da 82-17 TaxID=3377116 RepID=UPI0038D43AEB
MPRPTAAQLAYGSATVVFATLAMLLLFQTRSGLGVAVIAVASLALGLLVAVAVPTRGAAAGRSGQPAQSVRSVQPGPEPVSVRPVRAGAEARTAEHSLHS